MSAFSFNPIGWVESDFKEKFGIPRQSGLAPSARGIIYLNAHSDLSAALQGLDGFTHIWVISVFHDQPSDRWRPTVRPPRLGGKKRLGVFATRTPHRPCPLALSALKLEKIMTHPGRPAELHVSGLDLLDGTPVLDIKPYLPYADSLPHAVAGWTPVESPKQTVRFSKASAATLKSLPEGKRLRQLIRQILELDPRPAHQHDSKAKYAAKIANVDVHWRSTDQGFMVSRIEDCATS